VHRNLAKFAGAVYFSWMNPRAQDHKQPGDNTVVHLEITLYIVSRRLS
jgi:hypothetical protein